VADLFLSPLFGDALADLRLGGALLLPDLDRLLGDGDFFLGEGDLLLGGGDLLLGEGDLLLGGGDDGGERFLLTSCSGCLLSSFPFCCFFTSRDSSGLPEVGGLLPTLGLCLVFVFFGFFLSFLSLLDSLDESLLDSLEESLDELLLELLSFLFFRESFFSLLLPFLFFSSPLLSEELSSLDFFFSFSIDSFFSTGPGSPGPPPAVLMFFR